MEEYEIQVLGSATKQKGHKGYMWVAYCAFLILAGGAVYALSLFAQAQKRDSKAIEKLKGEPNYTVEVNKECDVHFLYDEGIHDVPLRIFQPVNMNALLTKDEKEIPDSTDRNSFLAVLALDISPNSNLPFQEFAIGDDSQTEELSGYCAIKDGGIILGVTNDDGVMEYGKQHGMTFFRQIPLVIDGEICLNDKVRGKDYRRAIAKEAGYVYIIESENKESLYDFSVAIRGLGISDAVNLPDGYMQFKSKNDAMEATGSKGGGVYLLFK